MQRISSRTAAAEQFEICTFQFSMFSPKHKKIGVTDI